MDIFLCDNPRQVLSILKERNIDIILLDIMMPEVSGIDILKMIRSRSELDSMQVIMLTSITDRELQATF